MHSFSLNCTSNWHQNYLIKSYTLLERLLQGMETEAIPLKFRTPVIDLSMDATLRLVPVSYTHLKGKEIIDLAQQAKESYESDCG